MARLRSLLALGAVAVSGALVLGCGSTRYEVIQPPARPLGAYGRVEVREVVVDDRLEGWAARAERDPEESAELLADLAEALREELADAALFQGAGPMLVVVPRLEAYETEDTGWRVMGGHTISATVTLDLCVYEERALVARVRAIGHSRKGGWYVPSLGAAADRAVDAFVLFARDHR